jgi:hypothetical protein
MYVSHFCVFGSIAWAHIPDEKRKALQPKSEKHIFVGYSEDVKGYRLLQTHCNEIFIRRDVNVDENHLACEPNLTFMRYLACEPNSVFIPYLACEPNSMVVPSSACLPSSVFVPSSILVSYSDDDNEDENPPPPSHLPPDESFEPEPTLSPPLPRWVHSTREVVGDLVGDPSDQRWTRS